MPSTLLDELDVLRAKSPPGYLAEIDGAAATLRSSGARFGKPDGAVAPDFAFVTQAGDALALKPLLRRGPVVLSFFRGEWCPFCRAEIEALLRAQPAMAARDATLILLSPERPSARLSADVASLGNGAFAVRDADLGIALRYGLVYRVPDSLRRFYGLRNPPLAAELEACGWLQPLPADFVIDRDGRITLSFLDLDFTRRLEPALILDALDRAAGRTLS